MRAPLLIGTACGLLVLGAGLSVGASEPSMTVAVVVALGTDAPTEFQDVALIYRRKKRFWPDGSKVIPVNLPANNFQRHLFSQVVLRSSPEALEQYWNNMYFQGESPPFVLGSEEAVLRFVSRTQGAIGYVNYCSVDARVKVAMVFTSTGRVSEATARASCPG
jgi:hypothetical protein